MANIKSFIKRNLSFFKIFISYILFLIVPLIALFQILYPKTNYFLEKQVMQSNFDITDQVRKNIDQQIKNIIRTPSEIVSNENLRPYLLLNDNYNQILAMRELSKYYASNDFIHNVFLYIRGDNNLISYKHRYRIDEFNKKYYKYASWDYNEFLNDLNTVSRNTLRPSEMVIVEPVVSSPGINLITFILPLPEDNKFSYGTLLVQIDTQNIKKIFNTLSNEYSRDFFIIDESKKEVISHIKSNIVYDKDISSASFVSFQKTEPYITNINDTECVVSLIKSDYTKWTYISIIPLSEAMNEINEYKKSFAFGLILVLILELIIVFISIYWNYSPLRRLRKIAIEKYGALASPKDEIQTVADAIINLSRIKDSLNDKLIKSKPALKEYFLSSLIFSNTPNAADIKEESTWCGFDFRYPYFTCLVLSAKNVSEKIDLYEITDYIEKYKYKNADLYVKNGITSNTLILAVALAERNNTVLKELMVDIQRNIKLKFNMEVLIGSGEIYNSMYDISKSYSQALTVIEYIRVKRPVEISLFEDIGIVTSNACSYPTEDANRLYLSIIQKDTECIRKYLYNIVLIIKDENTPLYIVRCLFCDTVNMIIKGLLSYNNNDFFEFDIIGFSQTSSCEELSDILTKGTLKLCEIIDTQNCTAGTDVISEILDYINKNFMDPNFGIKTVSDYFGMTISNFSYFFRRKTDINFINYINILKTNYAKHLLKTTDKSIVEIATDLGYSNDSSFIRTFKKVLGITPGQYRANTHIND